MKGGAPSRECAQFQIIPAPSRECAQIQIIPFYKVRSEFRTGLNTSARRHTKKKQKQQQQQQQQQTWDDYKELEPQKRRRTLYKSDKCK